MLCVFAVGLEATYVDDTVLKSHDVALCVHTVSVLRTRMWHLRVARTANAVSYVHGDVAGIQGGGSRQAGCGAGGCPVVGVRAGPARKAIGVGPRTVLLRCRRKATLPDAIEGRSMRMKKRSSTVRVWILKSCCAMVHKVEVILAVLVVNLNLP